MLGNTHERIAAKALNYEPSWLQVILRPHWEWLQGGATLTDLARTYWEPDDSLDRGQSSLVHSYFIDKPDPRRRGAIAQIIRYITGTVSFIEEVGKEAEAPTVRDRFHGQVALYFGILSHHIADLNTPVHVGHALNSELERITSNKDFHNYYERELEKYSRQADLASHREPNFVRLESATFETMARKTYEDIYLQLSSLYANREENENQIRELAHSCFVRAVEITADVWYTIAVLADLTANHR